MTEVPGNRSTDTGRDTLRWSKLANIRNGLVYWGLYMPQQQPGSYQRGEMRMMKSVFSGGGNRSTRRKPPAPTVLSQGKSGTCVAGFRSLV